MLKARKPSYRSPGLALLTLSFLIACGDDGDGDPITDGGGASRGDGGGMDASVTEDAGGHDDGIADGLQVPTDKGPVEGRISEGTRAFLGIPYAAPPTGDNRWAAPQPVEAWDEPLQASDYGPICAQMQATGSGYNDMGSEDCLYLNVWSPEPAPQQALPVMVWFHGGAFEFGDGGPPYNGENLVETGDVVVVTLNYRLGALGFMAHPALTAEAQDAGDAPGNFGLLDQRAALRWVQRNIEAFGGDPDNVTMFGESAGGNSVCKHLQAESSRGLFHRAIVESGLCLGTSVSLEQAEATGERYAEALGCDDPEEALSCLRGLDAQTVTEGPEGVPSTPGGLFYQDDAESFSFRPIVDGVLITEAPEQAFAAGDLAQVPVLHGANTSEGILFHAPPLATQPVSSEAEYEAALANTFGEDADAVAAQYPVADYDAPNLALAAVSADAFFRCPAVAMAEYLGEAGISSYFYRFDLPLETSFEVLQGKAFHSAEIPYVFGNGYTLGSVPEDHQDASEAIMGYWTRFAATGDPNGGDALQWPAYESDASAHLSFADPIEVGSDWGTDACAFWQDL